MMKICFAVNYGSSRSITGKYVKVSVLIGEKGYFGVVRNLATKRFQMQNIPFLGNRSSSFSHLWEGRNNAPVYDSLESMMNHFCWLDTANQEGILSCCSLLFAAFKKYRKMDAQITQEEYRVNQDEYDECVRFMREIVKWKSSISVLNSGVQESNEVESAPKAVEPPKWKEWDTTNVSNEELNKVLARMNAQDDAIKPVQIDEYMYRFVPNDSGCGHFERMAVNGATAVASWETVVSAVPELPPVKVRAKEKRAIMKDASGLTEFVNGNFYKVVGDAIKESRYSSRFWKLLNDNGEERIVDASRVFVLDVYTEPPEQ